MTNTDDLLYSLGLKANHVWLNKDDVFIEFLTVAGRKLTFKKINDEPANEKLS